MKKTIILIISILVSGLSFAQNIDNKFLKYQAVARDNSGNVLKNRDISIEFSFFEENITGTGTDVFIENHHVKTNEFGIFDITIGTGTATLGGWDAVNFRDLTYSIDVALDVNGGSNYMPMGNIPVLYVPYAFHAETVEFNDDADADPVNEIQQLSRNGSTLVLSQNGGSVNINDADADPMNEIQTLSISGTQLTISDGNTVNLPTGGMGGTNDDDPNNEIQDLSSTKNGSTVNLNISLGGQGTTIDVSDSDSDSSNEIQTLSKNGNIISLSRNGGSIVDAVNDADADPGNEIQILEKIGTTVSLSRNGGFFEDETEDSDADPTNELQQLQLNGNKLSLTSGNEVDLSSVNKSLWTLLPNQGVRYNDGDVYTKNIFVDSLSNIIMKDGIVEINEGNYTSFFDENGLTSNYSPLGAPLEEWRSNWLNSDGMTISNGNGYEMSRYNNYDMRYFHNDRYAFFTLDSLAIGQYPNGSSQSGQSKLYYNALEIGQGNFRVGLNTEALTFDNFDYLTEYQNDGLHISQRINPQDEFIRVGISPDDIIMYNQGKFENVKLGTSKDGYSGQLILSDGGGVSPIARLGSSKISYSGQLELFSEEGRNVFINSENEFGELCLYDKDENCLFSAHANNGVQALPGGSMRIYDNNGNRKVEATVVTRQDINGNPISWGSVNSEGVCANEINGITRDGDSLYLFSNDENGLYSIGFSVVDRVIPKEGIGVISSSVDIFRDYIGGDGIVHTFGDNGYSNVYIGSTGAFGTGSSPNHGRVDVNDADGIPQAGIEVDGSGQGVVWGDVKNFRMDHPDDSNKEIVYASLEGPEAAAYSRGRAELINGKTFVKFPDHFRHVANSESMTIQLTPNYSKTLGLAVVERSEDGFWVEELMEGNGSFSFDWTATSKRKGFENFKVVRQKSKSMHSKMTTHQK